jgi:CRISPR-associated protein Csy2
MTNRLIPAGGLLILPRLKVQNANAISAPLTWGFPSPTAFTGFAHALERRLRQSGRLTEGFVGVGILCHSFDPQVARPAGKRTQVFRLTRNPMGKDGAPTALVEEGRAHLEVTLVIAVKDELYGSEGQDLAESAAHLAQGMRLAGGSILPTRPGARYVAQWKNLPDHLEGQVDGFRKLRRCLLPGFALVQREDLLQERLADMGRAATALDALLDLCRLNVEPHIPDPAKPEEVAWQIRKPPGWLVPLPIGYAGISPLYEPGQVNNTRDETTPFRFVESLYSLGQWIGPQRLTELQQLLWYVESDPDAGLYRCINRYSATLAVENGIA